MEVGEKNMCTSYTLAISFFQFMLIIKVSITFEKWRTFWQLDKGMQW